jgi:hypothetical protein
MRAHQSSEDDVGWLREGRCPDCFGRDFLGENGRPIRVAAGVCPHHIECDTCGRPFALTWHRGQIIDAQREFAVDEL